MKDNGQPAREGNEMRQRFGHLLPLTQDDADRMWRSAILTVDASVLLDLYRYHEQTQTGLLQALEHFKGRLWLSHQAANEFFRNRASVIANAAQQFEEANNALHGVLTSADKVRAFRLIPRDVASTFTAAIKREVDLAKASVSTAKDSYPYYLSNDPLLESIVSLFDGAVGLEPSEAELAQIKTEALRRQIAKIPPGFLDDRKEGAKAFGDYILWAQVLSHAAAEGRPVILVTSEKKDDWWEKHQGKRMPRRELLEEAARVTKQRVLLYETEHFLGEFAKRQGRNVERSIVAEIRAISMTRAEPSAPGAEDALVHALESLAYTLVDSDDHVTGLIAQTNASGFWSDEIEVLEIGAFEVPEAKFPFRARIKFKGDQDEDQVFAGDTIVAQVSGHLGYDGSSWELVDYEVLAELEDYGDEGEHE